MCSGFKEFSYAMTSVGHPAWFPAEQGVDEALSNLRQSRRYWILRMVIDSNNINETRKNVWVETVRAEAFSGPGSTLLSLTTLGVDVFAGKNNPECKDWMVFWIFERFHENNPVGFQLVSMALTDVQDAANDQTIEICEDFEKYCNYGHLPGPPVRLYCPGTCGCNNVGSSLAVESTEFGCPFHCGFSTYALFFLLNRSCAQALDYELTADPQWIALLGHWTIATSRWADDMKLFFGSHISGLLLQWGCFAQTICDWEFGRDGGMLLCLPAGGLKAISFWCSAACKCNFSRMPGCPRSCVFGQPVPTQSIQIQYTHPIYDAD